jgi:Domain of unknown function (DUF4157)
MRHDRKIPRQRDNSSSPTRLADDQSSGEPLPSGVRAGMEQRFAHNFGNVRIHADEAAAAEAETLDANAFTRERDIYFARGKYDPDSPHGRSLLTHELTHVVQEAQTATAPTQEISQPTDAAEREAASIAAAGGGPVRVTETASAHVHRDTPGAAPPPAAPPPAAAAPPPAAAPPQDDAAVKLLREEEDKAFEVVKGKAGQPAAKAWYSHPKATNRSAETEMFTIDQFLESKIGTPPRKGFDNQGAATTFATFNAANQGAVVAQEGKFFFVARLKAGEHRLSTVKPSFTRNDITLKGVALGGWAGIINPQWFRITSDIVYRVEAQAGVVAVTSNDGKHFPLGIDLTPDADQQELQSKPIAGQVPDAKDLRAYAGLAGDQEKPGEPPKTTDGVPIPEAEQDKFIASYFRSRALESLAQNESMAEKLAQTFKPTEPGDSKGPGKGVSPEAAKLIDGARVLGVYYRGALDKEAEAAANIAYLESYRTEWIRASRGKLPMVTVDGQGKGLDDWIASFKKDMDKASQNKMTLLSLSPLLATMTDHQIDPYARTQKATHMAGAVVAPKVEKPNPYDESLLAKAKTPESDEKVRADFEKKLDGVRQAIRQARGKANAGDLDYLLGLDGLRRRVEQDFKGVKGANAGLKTKLDTLLSSHAIKEDLWNYGTMAIDLALAFVPGGQLISACMGVMVHAVNQADLSDKMVSATATGLDPAKALADQQQMAHQMAQADFFFIGGLMLQTKSIVDELGKLESGATKAIKPNTPPPPDAPPPGGGGGTGPGGPGKTNTNWPPFDPNGPATNRNWPPVDPNAPPGTNKNWPPTVDPHGKTQVDPHGKTQVDPNAKTGVDPHAKTSQADPNQPPPKVDADPQGGSKTPNNAAPSVAPAVASAPWKGPEPRVLDASKYTKVEWKDLIGGADQSVNDKFGLKHADGKIYLFKPTTGEKVVWYADDMGVKAGDRARKAPAAAEMADRMGIKTPKADLVMWDNMIGSLQEWEGGMTKLVELRTTNPSLHAEVMASQAKKDLDAFQYLIAGLDAHEGNYLVKVDAQTKKWELVPVDMDMSLPPSSKRYTLGQPGMLGGHQAPLPPSVSKAFRERLEKMGATREQLRQTLSAYLSPAEIEGAMKRLDELLADSNPASPGAAIKVVP